MSLSPSEYPLPVRILPHPYIDFSPLPVQERPLPFGSVVVVDARCPALDGPALSQLLPVLRRRFVTAPVAVCTPFDSPAGISLSGLAARLGARAILPAGVLPEPFLRVALSNPAGMGRDITAWLARLGIRLSPAARDPLAAIFDNALEYPAVAPLLRDLGVPETTARLRMRKRNLPSPSVWHQLARATHLALRLQSDPDRALLGVALELGYSDHSALTQRLRRSFGLQASRVRCALGWEPLLHRWLRHTLPGRVIPTAA